MRDLRALAEDALSAADDVRAHLALLLGSQEFPASARRRRLLHYVVTQTLAGRGDQLKAYDLAISVLDRDASFDAQVDPIVRIEIGRLRRDLDHYYANAGRAEPRRITIPKGHYRVMWEVVASSTPELAEASVSVLPAMASQAGGAIVPNTRPPDRLKPAWPRLVVRPLRNLGGDIGDLLAVGLTEALFTDLLCYDGIEVFVGTPNGLLRSNVWIDESGPAFALDGIVEAELERLRVTVRLSDQRCGQIVWSNRFLRELPAMGVMDVVAELSGTIAGRLASAYGAIHRAAMAQLAGALSPDDRWFAYASVQRAFGYRQRFAKDAYPRVRADLDLAVRERPDCTPVQAMRAFTLMDAARYEIVDRDARSKEVEAGLRAARLSVEMDPESGLALQALAALRFLNGEVETAERLQRQALARCPSDPEARAQLAWRLAARGRLEEGRRLLQTAIIANPAAPSWYHQAMAMILFLDGDLDGARVEARLGQDYDLGPGYATVALVEAEAGNREVARAALAEALRRSEALRRDPTAYWRAFQILPEYVERFNAGLARAGL